MSVGYKKKDKDKDAKGAFGGEASANYVIGSGGGEKGQEVRIQRAQHRQQPLINYQQEKIFPLPKE
jgi:hypothetical protein